MQRFFKHINKFNGNACFSVSRDDGDFIFYAKRQEKTLSYAPVSDRIEGLCLQKAGAEEYFLVTHRTSTVTQFDGENVYEVYLDTSPYVLGDIVNGETNEFYALDFYGNKLIKFFCDFDSPSFVLIWAFELPSFNFSNSNITYRKSDKSIILSGQKDIFVIRDLSDRAVLISTTEIEGDSPVLISLDSQQRGDYSYLRWRQISGEELDQSSSLSSYGYSTSSSSSSSLIYSSSSLSSPSSLIYSSSSLSSESSSADNFVRCQNISFTTFEFGSATHTYTWVPDLAAASIYWWQNVPAYLTDHPAEDRAIFYDSGLGLWVLQDINSGLVVEAALGEFDDIVGTEAVWTDPVTQPHFPPNYATSIVCL